MFEIHRRLGRPLPLKDRRADDNDTCATAQPARKTPTSTRDVRLANIRRHLRRGRNCRVTDVPAHGRGRAYLVERELELDGYSALKALVSDYLLCRVRHSSSTACSALTTTTRRTCRPGSGCRGWRWPGSAWSSASSAPTPPDAEGRLAGRLWIDYGDAHQPDAPIKWLWSFVHRQRGVHPVRGPHQGLISVRRQAARTARTDPSDSAAARGRRDHAAFDDRRRVRSLDRQRVDRLRVGHLVRGERYRHGVGTVTGTKSFETQAGGETYVPEVKAR
jgi:hypothetical protein